ncbi:MAG: hypothetical protein A3B99_04955 [Candidatus Yanofskybacteria bacterium RIFCSPHIGHO2_02_FULL_44_12b]|nr:MAG: hypothetical protein A3B99_04955 [Candidatus Yanofskybacteria bacterium RIFCSPHIGHO2_02_FULL_44_12b]
MKQQATRRAFDRRESTVFLKQKQEAAMAQKTGAMKILRDYLGYKPGQALKDFSEELKQLSEAEKRELTELAAKELGVEVDWGPLQ